MENKIQENNVEVEEERVSLYRKIVEFIIFYLIANIIINIIYSISFTLLNESMDVTGFKEYMIINSIINVVVGGVDIIMIAFSITVLNRLFFRTICGEYELLKKIITGISIFGLIIGIIINGNINENLGISGGMYVHYIHYISITIMIMTSTLSKYTEMCKNAGIDELRKKYNIEKKTDWI